MSNRVQRIICAKSRTKTSPIFTKIARKFRVNSPELVLENCQFSKNLDISYFHQSLKYSFPVKNLLRPVTSKIKLQILFLTIQSVGKGSEYNISEVMNENVTNFHKYCGEIMNVWSDYGNIQ